MESYKFNDLISDLKIGREIEFCFDGNEYGIINNNGYWYFICNGRGIELSEFDDYDTLFKKLKDKNIVKVDFEDIFDSEKYYELYIL